MSEKLTNEQKIALLKQQMAGKSLKPTPQPEPPVKLKKEKKNEEEEESKPRAPKFNAEKFKEDLEAKANELIQNARKDLESKLRDVQSEIQGSNSLKDKVENIAGEVDAKIEVEHEEMLAYLNGKIDEAIAPLVEDAKKKLSIDIIQERVNALVREWSQIKTYFRKGDRPGQVEAIANFESGLKGVLKQ